MLGRVTGRGMAILVAVILLVATFLTFRTETETRTVSAHFDRVVQLYEGSEVRILGVNVGYVTAVVPEGNSVRVDMEYDAKYKVPADAEAVIVTPTLTADRFVQLTPAYTSGEQMETGGDIPLERTGSPVELDRIYASLDELSTALGPNNVNANGSLNTVLQSASKALDGQGAKGNEMLLNLSEAAETFGDGSGELFETVRGLQEFTTELARNDAYVAAFMSDLAGVSTQLSAERDELAEALENLAVAVGQVERFVRDNKELVESNVKALTNVTTTVAESKENLALALEKAPLGLNNLALAFDNDTGAIGARFSVTGNAADADGFLCSLVTQAEAPSAPLLCELFEALLEPIEGQIPLNPSDSDAPVGQPAGGGSGAGSGLGNKNPADSLDDLLGGLL